LSKHAINDDSDDDGDYDDYVDDYDDYDNDIGKLVLHCC